MSDARRLVEACAAARGQTVDQMIEDFKASIDPAYAEAVRAIYETGEFPVQDPKSEATCSM